LQAVAEDLDGGRRVLGGAAGHLDGQAEHVHRGTAVADALQEVGQGVHRLGGGRVVAVLAVEVGPALGGQLQRERDAAQAPGELGAVDQHGGALPAVGARRDAAHHLVEQGVGLRQAASVQQRLDLEVELRNLSGYQPISLLHSC
jgi:hypothetical protein